MTPEETQELLERIESQRKQLVAAYEVLEGLGFDLEDFAEVAEV